MIVDTYTLQIVFGDGPYNELDPLALERMIAETEENLTDLLPEGYRAVIQRWDNPGGEDDS
jgi:hypothetical protein